ncbi:MAG: DeoR family transcriptional regulator [Patescibacteria group bacterium]|jgi:transcriptional regulator of heat shock response
MPDQADKRKKRVFRAVVREYVESAEPVGSSTIVVKYHLGVSPATIRNDLAELEQAGLLEQPHTSAGRVPTERGYRYYVQEFVGRGGVPKNEQQLMVEAVRELEQSFEQAVRKFTRTVSGFTDEAVLLSFGPDRTYLCGLSNLFQKPESRDGDLPVAFSKVIDDIDDVVAEATGRLSSGVSVLIGRENPFGDRLSCVLTKLESPEAGEGLFGIVGAQRMDYDANVALANFIRDLLSKK